MRNDIFDFIERQPERAFWGFLALHVAFWTLLQIAVHRNPGLDLVEAATFGQHWQVVYWKHPPLPWLVADILRSAFGPALWPMRLAAYLNAAVALWAVWRLSREMLPPVPALVAVVLLEGVRSFTYRCEELNHDTISLPFWALSGWFFWRSVRDGRSSDWALTGLWFGLGFYAKYSMALLLLTCCLFLVGEPAARMRMRSRGPWLAAGILLVTIAPQIWALATSPVGPFAFARDRAKPMVTAWDRLVQPADFLVNQALHLSPLIALVILLGWGLSDRDPAARPRVDGLASRYVVVIALAPAALAVVVATAAGYGLRWSWGLSFWNFIGLAAIVWLRPPIDRVGLRRLVRALPAVVVLSAVPILTVAAGIGASGGVPRDEFAGAELARQVAMRWARHSDRPLRFVVGDVWAAGNVSFHLPERPYVYVDSVQTPWIDPEAVRRDGGAIVWQMGGKQGGEMPEPYGRMFRDARPEAPVRLTIKVLAQTDSQSFGVSVIVPRDGGVAPSSGGDARARRPQRRGRPGGLTSRRESGVCADALSSCVAARGLPHLSP